MIVMSLGDLVREERTRRGWSARELARRAGITPAVITRLERGERLGRVDTVLRVTSTLGIESATVEALMREQPEGPAIRERRTPYDIARELQAALEAAPILVPETTQPGSAGPGVGVTEAEPWVYLPTPAQRGHQFIAVPVSGNCMAPDVPEGARVIVDKNASPQPGDIVVVEHDGETLIKELQRRNSDLYLIARQGRAPLKVDESTRIIGVVVQWGMKLKRKA